uniref:Uncharacterized protein n=1 Tax=Sinocyclocheilus grahami TaxID=75366 RepID=A0A672RCW1_SINGR
MPEDPELHLASLYVPFYCDAYCIKAQSRGKEVRLTLTPIKNDDDGKLDDLPKHAHLQFYTKESPRRVLSFEDTLRFQRLASKCQNSRHCSLLYQDQETVLHKMCCTH